MMSCLCVNKKQCFLTAILNFERAGGFYMKEQLLKNYGKRASGFLGHTAKLKLLGWKKKPEARICKINPDFLRTYMQGI